MGLSGTAGAEMALAVDAGNSKTDVALVAADGTVLGTARGGGFKPPVVGPERAVAQLAPLVASVLAQGGVQGPVAQVSAYLANCDLPVEERELTQAVVAHGWAPAASVTVGNDTFALLRAGLPDSGEAAGVAVVCGAGINCAGLGPGGRTARFPSIGIISGDWGGGGHLADTALWWAARADDGRGPASALAAELPAHFGLSTMPELIEALHRKAIEPLRKHELTPVLFAVAAAGDAVAREIVARQAQEIAVMATVALERLELLAEPTTVVLGGGVLAARHPLLHDRVVQLLAERAPKAVPRVVSAPPVLGAALYALDRAGAPGEAYERLRGRWG